jgi:hypothetical protein
VLWPDSGTWDAGDTCNPNIVQGTFTDDGSTYNLALYYVAGDEQAGSISHIGVAFANYSDLPTCSAAHPCFHKYLRNPIIRPQNPSCRSPGFYGAADPSPWNRDAGSNITLFWGDDTTSNCQLPPGQDQGHQVGKYRVSTSSDGKTFPSPIAISIKSTNIYTRPFKTISFHVTAASPNDLYAVFETAPGAGNGWRCGPNWVIPPCTEGQSERENYQFGLYKASPDASAILKGGGTWDLLGYVDTNLTGDRANHTPGFRRNPGETSLGGYRRACISLMEEVSRTRVAPWARPTPSRIRLEIPAAMAPVTRQVTQRYGIFTKPGGMRAVSPPRGTFRSNATRATERRTNWVTTGFVTTDYLPPAGVAEADCVGANPCLGFVPMVAKAAGMRELFACEAPAARVPHPATYPTPDRFVTIHMDANGKPDCEGQTPIGTMGFLYYPNPPRGKSSKPVYRCNSGSDHFVSNDPGCEGKVPEGLQGYALTYQDGH